MPTAFDNNRAYLGFNQPFQARRPQPRRHGKIVGRSVTPVHHSAEAEEEAHGCRDRTKMPQRGDIEKCRGNCTQKRCKENGVHRLVTPDLGLHSSNKGRIVRCFHDLFTMQLCFPASRLCTRLNVHAFSDVDTIIAWCM